MNRNTLPARVVPRRSHRPTRSVPTRSVSSRPLSEPVVATLDADVVRELEGALFRYARRKVATDEMAYELVQDTWVAALTSLSRFAGRSSMKTWLTSILRRKIADLYRAKRDTVPYEETITPGPRGEFLERVIARESAKRVLRAMDDLTPREREAVELCGVEDLDREEAADRMGLSRPCLRVTLCRGRRHLRELAESA